MGQFEDEGAVEPFDLLVLLGSAGACVFMADLTERVGEQLRAVSSFER